MVSLPDVVIANTVPSPCLPPLLVVPYSVPSTLTSASLGVSPSFGAPWKLYITSKATGACAFSVVTWESDGLSGVLPPPQPASIAATAQVTKPQRLRMTTVISIPPPLLGSGEKLQSFIVFRMIPAIPFWGPRCCVNVGLTQRRPGHRVTRHRRPISYKDWGSARSMKRFRLGTYVLSGGVAAALLAACGALPSAVR